MGSKDCTLDLWTLPLGTPCTTVHHSNKAMTLLTAPDCANTHSQMSAAVMPILISFVGRWRAHGRCTGGLLVARVLISSTPAGSGVTQWSAPVVRGALLELLHVDGWGRLVLQGHAILLHCIDLALEWCNCWSLRLDGFLGGGISSPKVCDGLAIENDGAIVIGDSGHPIAL